MATLEDILTFPQESQGLAWLLLQRKPNVSLGELRKLASKTQTRQDIDLRLTELVRPIVGRAVCQNGMLTESPTIASNAIRHLHDAVIAELGEYGGYIGYMLGRGYSADRLARILEVADTNIHKRVARCRIRYSSENLSA